MQDPRVRETIELAEEINNRAHEKNDNPTVLVSALLMVLNHLAEQGHKAAPKEYTRALAKSLRQCADHWEHGTEPQYTHVEEEPN